MKIFHKNLEEYEKPPEINDIVTDADLLESVEKFNIFMATVAFHYVLGNTNYTLNREQTLEPEEVRGKTGKGSEIWIKTIPEKINVGYLPPSSMFIADIPIIHVQLYDADEIEINTIQRFLEMADLKPENLTYQPLSRTSDVYERAEFSAKLI